MQEALRRESISSGPYENVAPLFQQQKNNRSVSQYARPNTIDNAPSILPRYNSNRSSRPHSSGSFTSQDFYKNFTETRNTGNANQKSTIRISSNDFSDDESIYDNEPIKIVGSATLTEPEYAPPAELPQSHILKERLLEHIQGHHKKKHIADVQAALNVYFSYSVAAPNSAEMENRIRSLRFTSLYHLKGFLDALLEKHKTKGAMYQLVAELINNDAELKKTFAINKKIPLKVEFIDNRQPVEPPFLTTLCNKNNEVPPTPPNSSFITHNQPIPHISDAIKVTQQEVDHSPLKKITFSELNAQLKELLLAYTSDTHNPKKHKGNVFTALNGKFGIKKVASATEVETLIHSINIQHIDQLGSILNLLLCTRQATRPFSASIQQFVETHPLLHTIFKFSIEKNHLVLGTKCALTSISTAEPDQSEEVPQQGIEALLSALNSYYANPKHKIKLDQDLANEPYLHQFIMRDRLPLNGDPAAKLIWVDSGPTKSAELNQFVDKLSKHHKKNGTLLKLICPIYEKYFPKTEIGEKAIQVENNQFENAREKAIQAAIRLDRLHSPALKTKTQKYDHAKANFKRAFLEHISTRSPQANFDQDVLPALKSFTSTILETEIAVASFEAYQKKLNKDKLNANAMGLRQNFKKEWQKANVSVNTSNFENSVKQLATNHQKQFDEKLKKLVSTETVQEKIKEKTDKACGIAHERFQKEPIKSTNPFVIKDTVENLLSRHIQKICSADHISVIKQTAEIADENFAKIITEAIKAFSPDQAITASKKRLDAATIFTAWQTSFRHVLEQKKIFQEAILDTARKAMSKNNISETQATELLDALKSSQSINSASVKEAIRQQLVQHASELRNDHIIEHITAASREGNLYERAEKIQSLVREHLGKIEAVRAECARFDLDPDEIFPNNAHDVVKTAYDTLPAPLGFAKQLRQTFTTAWRGLIGALSIGGASTASVGGVLLGLGVAVGGTTLGIGLAVIGGIAILAASGLAAKKFYDAFQEKNRLETLKIRFANDYKSYLMADHAYTAMRNDIPAQFIKATVM